MIIETIKGNLLTEFKNQKFNAIAHGCNCFCLQKSGIAGQISKEFPEALQADKDYAEIGDWGKLGNFSQTSVEINDNVSGTIFNFYTQYLPGANFEYSALKKCLKGLSKLLKRRNVQNFTLGLPMIGAGIGSGDWNIIKEILEASSIKIIVVEYDNGNISIDQTKIDFLS